jgi:hypothetical protein
VSFRPDARECCKAHSHIRRKDTAVLPYTLTHVSPLAQAAALLVARGLCRHYELPCPSVEAVLTATGASRSRAYELVAALVALLATLVRPAGRPARLPPPAPSPVPALTRKVLRYVMQHPGCAHRYDKRQWYSDGFRHLILALREQHPDLALETFAALVDVPTGTLKGWLSPAAAVTAPASEASPSTSVTTTESDAPSSQIETVLAAWKSWHGTFVDFAEHVRHHLRIPMGRQLIAHILEAARVRLRKKRSGRSPDELALRGAFETFFPGAQWVGDGKLVRVVLGHEAFAFNLELEVDAHTGAFVGLSVRDTEDSAAVVESFEGGVATTGAAPLAQLLDNKPSNHAPEVDDALAPHGTLRIRATPSRPENKAHVEGAFGLFSQETPPITLDTHQDSRGIARGLLFLVALTWARAVNHRPRQDRGGCSRVELYAEKPNDEQIASARRALEERCRKQELARTTLAARQRPEVRALLDAHFLRLGLADPEGHVRLAIGRYPLDAIVNGIAIFDTKRQVGTLPDGADARYLLGVVRNVAAKLEGEALAKTLLALRLEARDQALATLSMTRTVVCKPDRGSFEVIADCVDRALGTDRCLDRVFWIDALGTEILRRAVDPGHRDRLYFAAATRINTTFRVSPRERQDALRQIAGQLVPLN